jgi:predicted amidohydrolase YtcJ
MQADLIIHNGNIITLDEEQPSASAIAVKDGRILKVGHYENVKPLMEEQTRVIDLAGKTVVPGFIDSHIHLISLGLDMQVIDLSGVKTKSEVLAKLRERTSTPRGNWVKAYGFEEEELNELPNRLDLDKVFPFNPVYLEEKHSKMCICNSLALENVDETGVTRVDEEEMLYKAVNIPTLDPVDDYLRESELELAIEIASRKVIEAGITSIHDPQLPPNALRAFKNAVRDGRTPLRLYLGGDKNKDIPLEDYVSEGMGTEPYLNRLKIGMVKLFADDRMSDPEFRKRVKEAHKAGFQLSIHATNIHETRNAIDALEEAIVETPRENCRHRIEHADNIDEDLLERAKILKLVVAAQPEIVYKFDPKYPEKVMKVAYKSLTEVEINVSGGSDSPTVPIKRRAMPPLAYPTPLIGMSFAVTRKTKTGAVIDEGEGVSVREALEIYTKNGAYTSFEEHLKGTLEEGKFADLAVLSDDPFKVELEKIGKIEVEMTIIGGEVVYSKV